MQLGCVVIGTALLMRIRPLVGGAEFAQLMTIAGVVGFVTIVAWGLQTREHRSALEMARSVIEAREAQVSLEETVEQRTIELEEAQRVLQRMWWLGQQIALELNPQRVLERFTLVGDCALRLVDFQLDVHPALQIEAALQRNATDCVVDVDAVTLYALDDGARKKKPARQDDQAEDDGNSPLQIHAAKEKSFSSGLAVKVTGRNRLSQRISCFTLVVRELFCQLFH